MAKVSPTAVKYMVYAAFEAQGPLEKPDVIGALFGQTEGLLGSELEMRELQKDGKVGRIEVELEVVDGKSVGTIQIPSALDKSETTLIAAALETIDKVGPTEAVIKITKIEDVRGAKRDYILDRAKQLLGNLEEGNGTGTMTKALKEESRTDKIQEYGDEKLPAGDLSEKEVIVVEGRADVVNMLKNRINNVIGMDGTKLPKEIAKLGMEKELTLFIDGDRGGKLIAKNVISNAKVAYVAVAPDGKEVEELEGKEIQMALRRKVSTNDFLRRERIQLSSTTTSRPEPVKPATTETAISAPDESEVKEKIRALANEIKNSRQAMLVDYDLQKIKNINPRDISRSLQSTTKKALAIIVDGTVTSSIVGSAEDADIKYIAATKFSSATADTKLKLISL